MSSIVRPIEEFQTLARPLVGLNVSLPWKGYGSAIFLELGELAPLDSRRQHHNKGEACISLEWDWRVEFESKVLFGSSNSGPKVESGIAVLQNTSIHSLSLLGQVPELVVQFSNGYCLRSMAMVTGDPAWSIKLLDGRWIYAENGCLSIGLGTTSTTEEEDAAFALAECAAKRWGVPTTEPSQGLCVNCISFIRIDGDGALLDYGACISGTSPFDGRVVNRKSGCPSFISIK